MAITKSYLKDLTYHMNGAAIEVHKFLGPGLLESVYHKCLKHELYLRGISYQSELIAPVDYKGLEIMTELRCDLLVENCLAIELKTVELLAPVHQAQLLTYMQLLRAPKGILYNFQCYNLFAEGQKTFVNEHYRRLEE